MRELKFVRGQQQERLQGVCYLLVKKSMGVSVCFWLEQARQCEYSSGKTTWNGGGLDASQANPVASHPADGRRNARKGVGLLDCRLKVRASPMRKHAGGKSAHTTRPAGIV